MTSVKLSARIMYTERAVSVEELKSIITLLPARSRAFERLFSLSAQFYGYSTRAPAPAYLPTHLPTYRHLFKVPLAPRCYSRGSRLPRATAATTARHVEPTAGTPLGPASSHAKKSTDQIYRATE